MRMRFRKTWTTHIPMLLKTVQMTEGPILELGGGLYSTPLLHWICAEKKRKLVTYEDDKDFFGFVNSFRSRNHSTRFITDWTQIDLKTHWSVVLIDHDWPANRVKDLMLLKDKADYIVVHDTTEMENNEIWSNFKYKHVWKWCYPHTTVVSNFKDLSNLSNP